MSYSKSKCLGWLLTDKTFAFPHSLTAFVFSSPLKQLKLTSHNAAGQQLSLYNMGNCDHYWISLLNQSL